MGEKERIDKWLWSVRIYKSRTMATDATKSGKVRIGDKILKPSTLIEEGQIVVVRKMGFEFNFKILKVISKRVSALLAAECYEDLTTEDELNKYKAWFSHKSRSEFRDRGTGRPTKRERREIDDFKEDIDIEDFYNFED